MSAFQDAIIREAADKVLLLTAQCKALREQRDAIQKTLRGLEEETAAQLRVQKLDDLIEKECRKAIAVANGSFIRAGKLLGISRSTLYRMSEKWQSKDLSEKEAS